MLDENNLIIIYGHGGCFKSSLGISLLNNYDNSCYINLENNSHIKINDSIKVFNKVDSIDFIKECINDYSAILVDYLELLGINKDELLELIELAKKEDKILIIISCCSTNKELMNNEHYNELKEIADLMILTDR
ncbi:MAG: hypothetical protein E7168_05950 [Firmicutes bacterium]|nr:hypothetical protein [Bacillota bacterium]